MNECPYLFLCDGGAVLGIGNWRARMALGWTAGVDGVAADDDEVPELMLASSWLSGRGEV